MASAQVAERAWSRRPARGKMVGADAGEREAGRGTALRRAVLAVAVLAALAVGPAAWAQDETFGFTVDGARLAADRHTVVVRGTYLCGRR